MIKIYLKVITKAKHNKIEALDPEHYKIWTNAPPIDGKANKAVIKYLSKYFKTPKSKINILKGETSQHKIVEIG